MGIETIGAVRLPDYAASYLVNGDSSGISEEDIQNIDNWIDSYYEGYSGLIWDIEGEEGSFDSCPPFGLACNTFKCMVFGHAVKREA